jgi:hypothetical protein
MKTLEESPIWYWKNHHIAACNLHVSAVFISCTFMKGVGDRGWNRPMTERVLGMFQCGFLDRIISYFKYENVQQFRKCFSNYAYRKECTFFNLTLEQQYEK